MQEESLEAVNYREDAHKQSKKKQFHSNVSPNEENKNKREQS